MRIVGWILASLMVLPPIASRAADYPARPLRWVVPYPAGGSTDIVARVVGAAMSATLQQPVVIDNRGGAAGNIGTEFVVKSPPDGYTLLFTTVSLSINETAYEKLAFDRRRDLLPIVLLTRLPNVMVVPVSLPVASVADFIAFARARPGQVNFGSGGTGTSIHVAGELFRMMTGLDMVHVPYRGDGPALQDLLAGQIQVMFGQLPAAIEQIRAGKLRALGVTTAMRAPMLPDLPTIAEAGVPGYEATGWYGLLAPAGTSDEIVARINQVANDALQQAAVRARLAELGTTPAGGTPAAFSRFLDTDSEKWAKVVRAAKIVID